MSEVIIEYDFYDESHILPPSFNNLLDECTLAQKKAMLVALRNSIKQDIKERTSRNINFDQYVEVVKNFVPEDFLDDAIKAEVQSLGLVKKTDKPQTQWLSYDTRAYCFSDKENLKRPAIDINQFPVICDLLKRVNSDPRTTQNADGALVIVYNSNSANIDYHDDGEKLMDGGSSISTVTFGSDRDINFCNHSLRPRVAQHTVQCGNHDMMIMKPGCQENLVHKVCRGNRTVGDESDSQRIVISFRKVTPEVVTDPEVSFDATNLVADKRVKDVPTPPTRITIIAGDSFSAALDAKRLGRNGKKTVVNLSKGGSTIKDVSLQLDSYFLSDARDDTVVEKVFVCVGANDIRNCRNNGVRHLKSPLVSLVDQIKMIFPDALVWFQCLLPLPMQHQYSVRNVEQFNKLLLEVCTYKEVYFLGHVFKKFLVFNLMSNCYLRRESLFPNRVNIHPNKLGLSIIASHYIRLIHSNSKARFNPLGY